MPRMASRDGLDKFTRYRANRRARGMRLLRVWLPDPRLPGFREEARRQAALLRSAPEEIEILQFLDAAAADIEDWTE